jgi:hypothetical protein
MNPAKNERGSAVVLVVLALAALIGFAALTMDVGVLYLNHHRLSNATDAAALAAIQVLGNDPTAVTAAENTARDYALKNGLRTEEVSVTVYSEERRIKIYGERDVSFFLAPVLGLIGSKVSAEAEACFGAVEQVQGAIPIGVRNQEFEYGEEFILHYNSEGGEKGNFGGLRMPGGNGKEWYRTNLREGYPEWLQIGQKLWTEPGVGSGPTKQGLETRFTGHVTCTLENHEKNCPRLVVMPIIDSDAELSGTTEVPIVGFAAFYLKEVPSDGEVKGYFLETLSNSAQGTGGNDYGLRAAKLTK